MAGFTLVQCRAKVKAFVDDDGSRWTDTDQTGEVDLAIASALSRAMGILANKGRSRFSLEHQAAVSSSDGSIDLSSLDPLQIHEVAVKSSNIWARVPACQRTGTHSAVAVAETIRVVYTPQIGIPATASNKLTSDSAAPASTAFDTWVCALAAEELMVKDAEINPALSQIIGKLEADAFLACAGAVKQHVPGGPGEPRYAYNYAESSQTIYLVLRDHVVA